MVENYEKLISQNYEMIISKNVDKTTEELIEEIIAIREAYLKENKVKRYSENHIFDENKSVKWNREEVKRKNELYRSIRDVERFYNDIIVYAIKQDIIDTYGINKDQSNIIFERAYDKYHSDGFIYILYESIDLADFYFRLKEKENA